MRKLCFILLPLLLVACTDTQPLAPIEDGPAFNWMNNPDNGNARIYRSETDFGVCWSESWPTGLRACHWTWPVPPIVFDEFDCGLQEGGGMIEFQDVGIWNEEWWTSWIHEVVKGKVFITVRDQSQPGDCFGDALVAEGWGRFRYVDNDIFGYDSPGNNTNAWSFRGDGELEAPDGSRVEYNGHRHIVCNEKWISEDNESGCKVNSSQVNVH